MQLLFAEAPVSGAPAGHPEQPELSIVMPCLNERLTVGICVGKAMKFLREAGVAGEVVVADNGSTDGSQQIAQDLGARVVSVAQKGYGAALIAGITAARGRYVIMGDSDDSYDFLNLDDFLRELRGGRDLVMGNRFLGGIEPGAMPPLHRYLGNPVLSGIGRLLFRSAVRDFHCGLRGFRRESILALDLQTTGMEFASEMVVKATLHGLSITEVPTTLRPDGRDRPPHLRSWRDGWRHLRFLLVHAPMWLFMWPGLVLFLSGLAATLTLAFTPVKLHSIVLDIHTMLYASAAASLGFQMLLLAALSTFHAHSSGTLPRIPRGLRRVLAWISLERGLVIGLLLVLCALALAGVGLATWSQAGFAALDPRHVMRVAIPSCMLLVLGGETLLASFMFEVLRVHR